MDEVDYLVIGAGDRAVVRDSRQHRSPVQVEEGHDLLGQIVVGDVIAFELQAGVLSVGDERAQFRRVPREGRPQALPERGKYSRSDFKPGDMKPALGPLSGPCGLDPNTAYPPGDTSQTPKIDGLFFRSSGTPHCGGAPRVIGCIETPEVIETLLTLVAARNTSSARPAPVFRLGRPARCGPKGGPDSDDVGHALHHRHSSRTRERADQRRMLWSPVQAWSGVRRVYRRGRASRIGHHGPVLSRPPAKPAPHGVALRPLTCTPCRGSTIAGQSSTQAFDDHEPQPECEGFPARRVDSRCDKGNGPT